MEELVQEIALCDFGETAEAVVKALQENGNLTVRPFLDLKRNLMGLGETID